MPNQGNGVLDQTQAYCLALLNQEKSLEELQRHLHKTEVLFRDSIRRKNQQLDVLQAGVRRLKSNVAGREFEASDSVEDALDSQAAELDRLRHQLATRDLEVDALAQQVTHLKSDLAEERAWRQAEALRAAEAASAKAFLDEQRVELIELRDQLAAAQDSATRLQAASADAEAALLERDAELKRLRVVEREARQARASHTSAELELAQLHAHLERVEQEPDSHRRPANLAYADVDAASAIAPASNTALEAELQAVRTATAAAAHAEATMGEAAEAAAVDRRRLSGEMEKARQSGAERERRLQDGESLGAEVEQKTDTLRVELETVRVLTGGSLLLGNSPRQQLGLSAPSRAVVEQELKEGLKATMVLSRGSLLPGKSPPQHVASHAQPRVATEGAVQTLRQERDETMVLTAQSTSQKVGWPARPRAEVGQQVQTLGQDREATIVFTGLSPSQQLVQAQPKAEVGQQDQTCRREHEAARVSTERSPSQQPGLQAKPKAEVAQGHQTCRQGHEAARVSAEGPSSQQLGLQAQPTQPLESAASPPTAGETVMLGGPVSLNRPMQRSSLSERHGVARRASLGGTTSTHSGTIVTGSPAAGRAGGEDASRIAQLLLHGDAVVSFTLTAVVTVATPDTSLAYTWFRAGTPLKKSEGPEYTVTAADLRCEISVRVTPLGPGGATGTPHTAATSSNVSVAADVPHTLRSWVQRGENKFDGLLDAADRERAILFTGGKVKLREVKENGTEKTIAKDQHMSVRCGATTLNPLTIVPPLNTLKA
jgi:hypothetical protein